MLITKTNPKGIDAPIQDLQKLLYNRLCATWNIVPGSDVWQCYGRAYKNQGESGYVPEVYVGNNEYREVYYDDAYPVISFFGVSDLRRYDAGVKTDVYIVFEMDLEKIKPAIAHRGDEEVHAEVMKELWVPRFGFELAGIETGIDNVYREFNLYKQHTGLKSNTEIIKYRDMHPLHCFRVNLNLNYQNKNC